MRGERERTTGRVYQLFAAVSWVWRQKGEWDGQVGCLARQNGAGGCSRPRGHRSCYHCWSFLSGLGEALADRGLKDN